MTTLESTREYASRWLANGENFWSGTMEPEILVFMPNGDVTLTLVRNVVKDGDNSSTTLSVASHASVRERTPIEEDDEGRGRREGASELEAETPAERAESFVYFAPDPPGAEDSPFYPPPLRARGSDASSRRQRSESPPASFWANLRRRTEPTVIEDGDQLPTPPKSVTQPERIIVSSHEVQCVVSSRHMMLASPYFQSLLGGSSDEAITLRSRGKVSISVEADLDAMIVLLNIIHGASRKVPRQVSLELLTKLGVLVRSFSMLETVQFFSDTWIENLQRDGLPKVYNEEVIPFLFVFWVFDRPSEFKNMSRLAQQQCDEKLEDDVQGIPIPRSVINAIKKAREVAIESAISVINSLINKYMDIDNGYICDGTLEDGARYACDAMVLGSLMKSARNIGIWPKPEAPFHGRKFKDLARAIRRIKVLDVCAKNNSRRYSLLGPSSNCHGLEDSIEVSMKVIEASLDGLELSDYVEKSELHTSNVRVFLLVPPKDTSKEQANETIEKSIQVDTHPEFMGTVKAKEEVKVVQKESPVVSEFIFFPPADSKKAEEPVQKEEKAPARQHSGEFQPSTTSVVPTIPQSPKVNVSPRVSVQEVEASATNVTTATAMKEDREAIPRNSLSQETGILPKLLEKLINPPPEQEIKPTASDDVLMDRKLRRTTSHAQLPIDTVKSPHKELQTAPVVASIEKIMEQQPRAEKDKVKISFVETKEAPPPPTNHTHSMDEDQEHLGPLPNLKIRMTKMRFATKF